jgi:hypothetical protein
VLSEVGVDPELAQQRARLARLAQVLDRPIASFSICPTRYLLMPNSRPIAG